MKKLAAFALVMVCALSLVGCGTGDNLNRNPFGHLYCIDDVLYSGDTDSLNPDTSLIQLNEYHSLSLCTDIQSYDYSVIGKFETVEADGDPFKGPWQLFADEAQTEQYHLQLEDDGTVILSFLKSGVLQWKYQLHRVDVIDCNVMTLGSMTTIYPDWLYPNTFSASPENLIYLSSANINGKGTVKLLIQDESISSITIYEAYYTNESVEYKEYILEDDFELSVSTRYKAGEQFAIYCIPCGGFECWFYLKFD